MRNFISRIFQIVLCIIILSIDIHSQDIALKAYTDKQQYYIGDYIKYNLDITYNKGTKILPPSIKDSLNQFELISSNPPIISFENGKKKNSYTFVLAKYDSADIVIPAIPIYFASGKDTLKLDSINFAALTDKDSLTKKILSNEVSIKIRALNVVKDAEIKDIKGPNELPPDYLYWAVVIIGSLLFIAIISYFIFKYFKKRKENKLKNQLVEIVPPYLAALKRLDELEGKKLWQNGLIKEYHSNITEIIRQYFEEQFNLPALELTTSEIMKKLDSNILFFSIKELTSKFLTNADMVKFAKFVPLNDVNEEMMKQAKEIITAGITVESSNVANPE